MQKKCAVVSHSGGMDSSLTLALAIKEWGKDQVLSMTFDYGQRNAREIESASAICKEWGVDHLTVDIRCLQVLTKDALTDSSLQILHEPGKAPNTMVVGRNGLFARLAAIHVHHLGGHCVYMGIIKSYYRDCNRNYMDLEEQVLRLDLDNPSFEIRTPLVDLKKAETFVLAKELGVFDYLNEVTVTCYEGIVGTGCGSCPACILRNTSAS